MISVQKQQAVKNGAAPKFQGEKRCEIKGGGLEMTVIIVQWKILITTIQVNLVPGLIVKLERGHRNSPELSLLKVLRLNYYRTSFFTHLLGPHPFSQLAVLYRFNIH